MFLEFDLAGAEWVIVAYLTQDANMLKVVNGKRSPHVVTGNLISQMPEDLIEEEDKLFGHETNPDELLRRRAELPGFQNIPPGAFIPRTMTIRQMGKKSNHGLNYGMEYRRFALENEISETEGKAIVQLYREQAYPGLLKWYEETRRELKTKDRTLTNCFGRRVRLLGEWGPDLFNKAYSFRPQSTVGDSINTTIVNVYTSEARVYEKVRICSQTHDSVLVQYPEDDVSLLAAFIRQFHEDIRLPLTYNDQTFRLNSDLKIGYKWGSLSGMKIDDGLEGRLVEFLAR